MERDQKPDPSGGYDSYIDPMEQRMTIRKNQKKNFPYRKQFTMPKRLPSTGMDNMLNDGVNEQDSLHLTDEELSNSAN